jgi:predicted Zn-dependent peptidase
MRKPEAHQQITVNLDVEDVTFLVRWAGPSVREGSTASYAADLFATIINDPTSDFQERLVDTGLFQSVSMSYRPLAHVGPIGIRGLTTADRILDASMALNYAIARFSDPGYVTAEALRIARKRRAVEWAEEMETPSGLAYFVGDMWSVAGIDYLRGYRAAIDSLELVDLESYVASYLANRPHVFGVLLSRTTRGDLGPTLGAALAPWR